ncbi:MAG: response regulator [Chloroflexi bacterium]|nr:response regulator [Chloroflexota bacterium]
MFDRQTFAHYVEQTLCRLHDRVYLQTHPLAGLLLGREEQAPATGLQRVLREAIEQLRPDVATPSSSPAWRRYRHLVLRYVEGATLENTARELLVSVRQAHRDHAEAIGLVTASLWDRYTRRQIARPSDRSSGGADSPLPSPVEAELLKVAAASASIPTDVAEVAAGVLATIRSLAEVQGVTFRVDLPDRLAPVGVAHVALRQMLLNLLTYAIELRGNSDATLRARGDEASVQLEVVVTPRRRWSGPEQSSPDQRTEAEALLAVAQRLAEMQGGTVDVRPSEEGHLWIDLALPALQLTTVLLVDDNPDLARLFRRYLRTGGYRLVQATNAERARRLAQDLVPDVIILDVLMPSADGWEILQQIRTREATRNIPVIVCSVLPERTLARSLGVTDFLPKPVTEQDLLAALERCRATTRRAGHPARP